MQEGGSNMSKVTGTVRVNNWKIIGPTHLSATQTRQLSELLSSTADPPTPELRDILQFEGTIKVDPKKKKITLKYIMIRGWIIRGLIPAEPITKALDSILREKEINSQVIRHAIGDYSLPITVDHDKHIICFWQVIGVSFNLSYRRYGKFFCIKDISSYPREALQLLEQILVKDLPDEKLELEIKERFSFPGEIRVSRTFCGVFFT